MGQKKLIRFEAIKSFPNVLQYPEGMPGQWSAFFKNTHPLTLELACGKGEYTVGLAKMYPNRNFLGIDIKGNRLYIGAKTMPGRQHPQRRLPPYPHRQTARLFHQKRSCRDLADLPRSPVEKIAGHPAPDPSKIHPASTSKSSTRRPHPPKDRLARSLSVHKMGRSKCMA